MLLKTEQFHSVFGQVVEMPFLPGLIIYHRHKQQEMWNYLYSINDCKWCEPWETFACLVIAKLAQYIKIAQNSSLSQ